MRLTSKTVKIMIITDTNKKRLIEFIKFGIIGVINTIHFYFWYQMLLETDMHVNLAFSIAFILAMIGSYFLNTYITFKVKPSWKTFKSFPITTLPNFLISNIGVNFLVNYFDMNKKISGLIASLISIPITFLLTRFVLTGGKKEPNEKNTVI